MIHSAHHNKHQHHPVTTGADRSLSVREMMRKFLLSDALNANITELAINKPGEYLVEDSQGWHHIENPLLTLANVQGLATAMGVFNKKKLDRDHPIGSFTLPDGERCQVVLPPVCEDGYVNMTIRKPSSSRFTLADYAGSGRLKPALAGLSSAVQPWESELLALASKGDFEGFFRLAVEKQLNVVTVGGTGSGKTTFSKCLIDLYPVGKRLFTVEDSHELTTPLHPNSVHLFFSAAFSAKDVLSSCMRMKPDHIFITELRGDETWDYLMALKSGHSGSVTSIHANDCRGALYKICSYIKQSEVGQTLNFEYIMQEVMTTIDVVCFFEHTHLKELYYDPVKKLQLLLGRAE